MVGAYAARESVLDFYLWDSSRLVRRLGVDVANVNIVFKDRYFGQNLGIKWPLRLFKTDFLF